jgi:hypothetical protein
VGCRAITPHLVGLAGRLEDKPFHLVATHCQKAPREEVVDYIRKQGVAADAPNFTVTSFGRHPKVKGSGYVPYYMVFDHRGKLVHHHMCGDYHGGDGLKMIEWVDDLLAAAPEIYLGNEPFATRGDLAERIAGKKKLARAVMELEAAIAEAPDDTELVRIRDGVVRWRDRALARAAELVASRPSRVEPLLEALGKDLKGTDLAEPVTEKAGEVIGSKELKRAIDVEKQLAKIEKAVEKGGERAIPAARKKLDRLLEDDGDLPIAERVRSLRASLD